MRFLFILLLLFIGCDDNSVSPDVINYNSFDIEVLQDFIDANQSLNGLNPIDIGIQVWDEDYRLKELNLDENSLTNIPESIGMLSNLTHLKLHDNNIIFIPDEITNLSNLDVLDLSRNQIANLPESISDLNVFLLQLDYNELTTLPANFCDASEEDSVHIYYNNLCNEYRESSDYPCVDFWEWEQNQSNCCEGPEGQSNWTNCP